MRSPCPFPSSSWSGKSWRLCPGAIGFSGVRGGNLEPGETQFLHLSISFVTPEDDLVDAARARPCPPRSPCITPLDSLLVMLARGGGLGLGRHVGSLRAPSASRRPPRHEPVYLSLREAQARLSCTVPVVVVEHQRPLWSILVPTLRACEAPACADWVDGGGPTAGGGRRCGTEELYWRSFLFRFHAVLILTGTAFQNPSRKLVDLLAVLASSLRHGVGRN